MVKPDDLWAGRWMLVRLLIFKPIGFSHFYVVNPTYTWSPLIQIYSSMVLIQLSWYWNRCCTPILVIYKTQLAKVKKKIMTVIEIMFLTWLYLVKRLHQRLGLILMLFVIDFRGLFSSIKQDNLNKVKWQDLFVLARRKGLYWLFELLILPELDVVYVETGF